MFYIKYLTIYKVHMHAGGIRKLLYGCAYVPSVREIFLYIRINYTKRTQNEPLDDNLVHVLIA